MFNIAEPYVRRHNSAAAASSNTVRYHGTKSRDTRRVADEGEPKGDALPSLRGDSRALDKLSRLILHRSLLWNRVLLRQAAGLIAGILSPGRPVLVAGRLEMRLLSRQTWMHECHLVVVVMVVLVIVLMTRRRRRIGIHPDGDVHYVYLRRRYDGGRRLRRGLHLFRATDRVAASFAAPSRPADLTFPNGRAAVPGRRGCRCRDARRFHYLVPVRFANRRARQ